jgi:hypothetical protein
LKEFFKKKSDFFSKNIPKLINTSDVNCVFERKNKIKNLQIFSPKVIPKLKI